MHHKFDWLIEGAAILKRVAALLLSGIKMDYSVIADTDILTVFCRGERIKITREALSDQNILLDENEDGTIVGIQLLWPTLETWNKFRYNVPDSIRKVVDDWFAAGCPIRAAKY